MLQKYSKYLIIRIKIFFAKLLMQSFLSYFWASAIGFSLPEPSG